VQIASFAAGPGAAAFKALNFAAPTIGAAANIPSIAGGSLGAGGGSMFGNIIGDFGGSASFF
jgi:hypothetical protein